MSSPAPSTPISQQSTRSRHSRAGAARRLLVPATPIPDRVSEPHVPATPDHPSVPGTPIPPDTPDSPASVLTKLSDLRTVQTREDNQRQNDQSAQPGPVLIQPIALDDNDNDAVIRGTNIEIPKAAAAFQDFIRNFKSSQLATSRKNNDTDEEAGLSDEDSDDDSEPLYLAKLKSMLHNGGMVTEEDTLTASMEVDLMHLFYHSEECQKLYAQMEHYPLEIIPVLDLVIKRELEDLAVDDQFIPNVQVRPFNLRTVSNLRNLDPVKMDTLVNLRGMVVRSSPIIPDLQLAHFSCAICGNDVRVNTDRGRIEEPSKCDQCNCKDCFSLIHNRCSFADKQMVRLQETPDEVPAGQTPASVVTFCFDDLVDSVKPGDRVELTGVMRAQPRKVNPKITKVKSVYKVYLDVIHWRRITGMEKTSQQATNDSRTGMKVRFTEQRIQEMKILSNSRDIYDKLVKSLAPSIWEMDDIKRGILCMLFSGNHVRVKSSGKSKKQKKKSMKRKRRDDDEVWSSDEEHEEDNDLEDEVEEEGKTRDLKKRGDINILLCGDPGTSKSQLLSYVNKLSTRGVYTSGKGSSAVGLTASVVRDPETRELVLESGALVLSDLGICCIDEFDKLSDTTRSVLHEAMEQQTVSIAKAGIIASLNARTSILASANPVESRYNPNLSVVDNIKLPPTLLSRFDLIYLVLDSPNAEHDRHLAQHLVGLYFETPNVVQPPLDQETLRDYIDYARENIHPEISDEAHKELVEAYLELRGVGYQSGNGTKTISATTRQLESLIRLSEALAKMRYEEVVTKHDVREAFRLMKVATQAAATDPRTGRIDMDMIATGRSTVDREMEETLNIGLKEILGSRRGTRMSVRDITQDIAEIANLNVPQEEVVVALRRMEADGIIQFNERAQTVFVRSGLSS